MVSIKKSLLCTVLMAVLSCLVFSQENLSQNSTENNQTEVTSVQTESNNSFESNASYFNNNSENNNVTQKKGNSTVWVIFKFVFFLAIICVAIYFLMKYFKSKNNVSKSDDDFLRRVSYMTLSPGKTVEIVTLLDKGYILGVTESNINLIAEINDKELLEALNLNFDKKQNTKKPMNFSDVLDMFTGKNLNKNANIFGDVENNINKINRNSFAKNDEEQ